MLEVLGGVSLVLLMYSPLIWALSVLSVIVTRWHVKFITCGKAGNYLGEMFMVKSKLLIRKMDRDPLIGIPAFILTILCAVFIMEPVIGSITGKSNVFRSVEWLYGLGTSLSFIFLPLLVWLASLLGGRAFFKLSVALNKLNKSIKDHINNKDAHK